MNDQIASLRAQIVGHIARKSKDQRKPQNLHWNSSNSGYPKELLSYEDYLARIDRLQASNDPVMIIAAIEAMQRILGLYSEQ